MEPTLQERLENKEVIILDGAMGTELELRGVPMHDEAWSGAAVWTHPEVVRATHEDYIRAGADVIITNTFAAARPVLAAAGLQDKVRQINTNAVRLAQEARTRVAAARQICIAGAISLMPPGADKRRRPPAEHMRSHFQEQAEILAAAGVDVIALEMMRDIAYSLVAIDAAVATGLPVWVGFSCQQRDDGTLIMVPALNGETRLDEVLGPVMQRGGSVVTIMHSGVDDTGAALAQVLNQWQGPVGAYPNSGSFVMPHWQFVDIISPQALVQKAKQWVAMGVQVIGGCCGIGPEHIRLLKQQLPSHIA